MTTKLRQEQADALGGCAECRFEEVPKDPTKAPSGEGPPPRSVIVVDPNKTGTFIGIELLDVNRKPVPYARFIVTPTGVSPIEGTLDVNGRARIEGIDPGPCRIVFPKIDRRDFV